MLVLSRHKGESIVIGGGLIEIVVTEIRGDKVRIGVKAPRDVVIDRREVHEIKVARASSSIQNPGGEE
ncbi:Carbon storage regulator [Rubripirellula lacrimiformis]|uniref:Translational regulator CsrA n=1 Tax=Rubripirellula lacrimiformis TaxID=1930273 RepID=A0A517NLF7_9BACT|nr:carbon storage regulator [Rubripirellula lacrimiformis]QDT07968.1 Carbon storage regulator [Rubripirellula lacrimiformis]